MITFQNGKYISSPLSEDSIKALDWLYNKYESASFLRDLINGDRVFEAREHEAWELINLLEWTQGVIPCLTLDSEINDLLYHLALEIV